MSGELQRKLNRKELRSFIDKIELQTTLHTMQKLKHEDKFLKQGSTIRNSIDPKRLLRAY